MTSDNKVAANRANARQSTGPKTARGKAAAKLNALAHGLRAEATPVLPGEPADVWDAHRAGTVAALAPVGALEADLADRVAALTWRLRRAVAYETAVTAAGVARAAARARGEPDEDDLVTALSSFHRPAARPYATVRTELDAARANAASAERFRDAFGRLPGLPDDHPVDGGDAFALLLELTGYTPDGDEEAIDIEDRDFLAAVGVPDEWRDDPDWWDGWTAALVRAGAAEIAAEAEGTAPELLARAAREAGQAAVLGRRKVARLEAELAELEAPTAEAERVARGGPCSRRPTCSTR